MKARQNIIEMYHNGIMSQTKAVALLVQCDPTLGLLEALDLLA